MFGRPVFKIAGIAPILLSLTGIYAPAYAAVTPVGFQWISPSDNGNLNQIPTVEIPPPPRSAPLSRVQSQPTQNPEIISPVIIDGSQSSGQNLQSQYDQQRQQYSQQAQQYSQQSQQYATQPNQNPAPSYGTTSYTSPSPSQLPASGTVTTPTSNSQIVVSSSSTPSSGTVTPGGTAPAMVGSGGDTAPMVGGAPQNTDITPAYSGTTISTSTTTPPLVTTSGPGPAVSGDVVQGFANQVPLAVALRQLLPPGYGFSVDQNVDLGTLVSFQGGRPWRDTLRDSLQPSGLVMHEQGQMVTISHAGGPMMAAANPPPMAQPVIQPAPVQPVLNGPSGPQPVMQQPMDQPAVNVSSVPMPAADNSMINSPSMQSWSAERGDTLHKVLADWARRANVEFEWQAEYDYPLEASISYTGTFEEAVRNILTGFEGAHPQPIAELHTNPNLGQMVLIIETRGNNYSD